LVVVGQAAGEIRPQHAENLLLRIADLQRRIDRGDNDSTKQRIAQLGGEIDDRASGATSLAHAPPALHEALQLVIAQRA
jgi:hypothetical protein